jgi:hypothetical protein
MVRLCGNPGEDRLRIEMEEDMSDVTGPISTLPGATHAVPKGTMCDDHPDRPAVFRIQGETDSFGCELNDMCQECYDLHKEARRTEDTKGVCDWCTTLQPKLFNHRDWEEGSCGRVYLVCSACIKKENDALREEADEDEFAYDDYDYDYYDVDEDDDTDEDDD